MQVGLGAGQSRNSPAVSLHAREVSMRRPGGRQLDKLGAWDHPDHFSKDPQREQLVVFASGHGARERKLWSWSPPNDRGPTCRPLSRPGSAAALGREAIARTHKCRYGLEDVNSSRSIRHHEAGYPHRVMHGRAQASPSSHRVMHGRGRASPSSHRPSHDGGPPMPST